MGLRQLSWKLFQFAPVEDEGLGDFSSAGFFAALKTVGSRTTYMPLWLGIGGKVSEFFYNLQKYNIRKWR